MFTPVLRLRDTCTSSTDNVGQKRKRGDELGPVILDGLAELKSDSSRYNSKFNDYEVKTFLQWHWTTCTKTTQLIFDKRYQRDHSVG